MTLGYLETGDRDDPVALLLHGFPDVPHTFMPVAESVAASGFRAIVPWMRGYGPSPRRGPYHVRQLAADVIGLAEAVSPDRPCAVVGHDWGAITTYAAIAASPDRFAAAVTMSIPHLMSFAHNARRSPRQILRSSYIPLLGSPLGPLAARAANLALIDALWRVWSPGYQLPARDRQRVHDCLRESLPAPVRYYRALPETLAWFRSESMRRLQVPTLYLHGARDGCCSIDMARGQERFFSSHETRVHEGVGHFMQCEDPESVSEDICAFLTRSHM